MDSSRSRKSRSLALDPKLAASKTTQRPGPGERRTSAPTVARSRHSTAKPPSESAKEGSTTTRSSRASTAVSKESSSGRSSVGNSARQDERSRDSRSKARAAPQPVGQFFGKKNEVSKFISNRSNASACYRIAMLTVMIAQTSDDIQQINLAVLGAQGVGKSTFIQHALDIRKPTNGPVSSSKVALSGVTYRFQLLELDLDDIDYTAQQIKWPKYINSQLVPPIDGVLCLYDITDQESIAEIPELLRALTLNGTPCVLTACKCDQPNTQRKVDPGFNAQVRSVFPGIPTSEASATAPESSKKCILTILKSILATSRESSRHVSPTASRPGAATTPEKPAGPNRGSASNSRSHSRSKSDFPRSRPRPYETQHSSSEALPENDDTDESSSEEDSDSESDEDEDDKNDGLVGSGHLKQPLRLDTSPTSRTRPYQPQTPVSANDHNVRGLMSPFEGAQSDVPQTPESFNVANIIRPGTANTADSRAHQTFLFLEEESQDESSPSDRQSSISEFERLKISDKEKNEVGLTFSELINRLLSLPSSKQETKLSQVFLCLYRAFATPRQLLTSIISRFDEVGTSSAVQLTKAGSQLRYLQVLGEWTAAYPGDFADPVTRHLAHSFVSQLERIRSFGPAAKEIGNNLEAYVEDDDAAWAYVEPSDIKNQAPKLTTQSSTGPASPNQATKEARGNRADVLPWEYLLGDKNNDNSSVDAHPSPRHSGAPSTASSLLRNTNASSQSLTNLLNLENARQKAQKVRAIPRNRLSKIQWHQFMDTPAEDFAREITRIDWIMYSAIRPRDFVRHVMGTSKDRKQKKGTLNDNIGAMVKHFNHLAVFVSGMILLRDKPKHRAKAVEKWMAIAWKVRQLNNYNSLGAIVAGINGHEIARLSATRELVPPQVQKDFLRLTILMGLSRGHAAYRLAWENSFNERIPFIPLLRQDLTLASNGMSTWIAGEKQGLGIEERKINWRKFEVMGEVIVMIQNSQMSGYKFGPRDEEIVKLILETRVLEGSEDSADPRSELYERSVQIEPAGSGAGAGVDGKKKFDWFRR